MCRQSVYECLKTALQYRKLPYHHFEDDTCTIAFESWQSFDPFDQFLSGVVTADEIKFNIYAKRVEGRSDGVAVTVSDEVQHLGYWDMYLNMREKVAAFESMLSAILRSGIQPLHYNYENFSVNLRHQDLYQLPPTDIPYSVTIRERDDGSRYYTLWLDFSA